MNIREFDEYVESIINEESILPKVSGLPHKIMVGNADDDHPGRIKIYSSDGEIFTCYGDRKDDKIIINWLSYKSGDARKNACKALGKKNVQIYEELVRRSYDMLMILNNDLKKDPRATDKLIDNMIDIINDIKNE